MSRMHGRNGTLTIVRADGTREEIRVSDWSLSVTNNLLSGLPGPVIEVREAGYWIRDRYQFTFDDGMT